MSINFSEKKMRVFLTVGIVLIAIIAIAIFLLQAYLNAPVERITPATSTSSATSTTPVAQTKAPATTNILVPKSVSGEDFYFAINAVIADMQDIASINNSLTPVLQDISTRSTQKNYSGILTRINQARSLVASGATTISKFQKDLDALATSQSSITDTQVAQSTASFLATSRIYVSKWDSYFSSLSPVLNGSFPSQQQIDAVTTSVQNLTSVNTREIEQTKALIDLLSAKVRDANKASQTAS